MSKADGVNRRLQREFDQRGLVRTFLPRNFNSAFPLWVLNLVVESKKYK